RQYDYLAAAGPDLLDALHMKIVRWRLRGKPERDAAIILPDIVEREIHRAFHDRRCRRDRRCARPPRSDVKRRTRLYLQPRPPQGIARVPRSTQGPAPRSVHRGSTARGGATRRGAARAWCAFLSTVPSLSGASAIDTA